MEKLRTTNVSRPVTGRWIAVVIGLAVTLAAGPVSGPAFGQSIGLAPLTSFGASGWLAPGANAYLTSSGNTQRGLAWNSVTKNLVLPSRAPSGNNVVILNGTTGVITGTLNNTGVTGGSVALTMAGVSDDGQIFACNVGVGGETFKVYRWASESDTNAPSVAFSFSVPANTTGTSGTGAMRFGDAFDVIGSGTALKFAAAGTTTGTSGGLGNAFRNNGNFMVGKLDQSNDYAIYKAIVNTATSANNYRLSLSFVDTDTLIGMEGGAAKYTDFVAASGTQTGTNATVVSSIQSGAASLGGTVEFRIVDYTTIRGTPYMAVLRTGNASTGANANIVNVYDISSAVTQLSGTNPVLVASFTTTTGSFANGNNSGQVAWGESTTQDGFWFTTTLYALNTNNGVQAMVFTVPEPSTWAMVTIGLGACGGGAFFRSRFRRRRAA